MSTVDRISVELMLRDAGFRTGLAANRGLVGSAERAIVGAAKRIGNALETSLKVGAVGGAVGLGFAVKAAMDFETQLSAVRKTTGLAGGDLVRFAGRVKDLARALPGVSVGDLMGAAAEGGRQGMSDPSDLLEYVKTIGMVKIALDDIPVEESANGIGKLASNFDMAMSKTRGLASALNKLDDTSKASARQILQASLQSSQMAHALGISTDWALALSSGLVETGLAADTAGTAFSQILRRLSSEQENFADLAGVSAEQYAAALRRGPLAALELVIRRLQVVSAQQGGVAAIQDLVDAKVVDQQQTMALLALVQSWDKLADRARQANHELQTSQSLLKEVEVSGNTTEKQLGLLWNQFVLAGEAIGANFLPGIKAAVKHMGEAADAFARWAEGGSLEWIKQLGVDIADVFGGALKNWPGAMDLLGKLFESLFARIEQGTQRLRAGLLNTLADIQEQIPGGWGGDAAATRQDAERGVQAADARQRTADEELKKSAIRLRNQGRMERFRVDMQRQGQLGGPQGEPGGPQEQAQQTEAQKFLKKQEDQRGDLLKAQAQQIQQIHEEARNAGRRVMPRQLQELSIQHMQQQRHLMLQQQQEQAQFQQQQQQKAKQPPPVPAAPKEEEKGRKPLPGPDAPERKFAREFNTRLGLARIQSAGGSREAAGLALEDSRKGARDELQRKLQDDLRREQEGPDGEGPKGPEAFKRMGAIMSGLEKIRWEKFQEARGEIGRDFMRDEAARQEDRAAAMQERMYSVQSGSADDFASAVQAGIGKTGDVQGEIRDYNRRMTELLERLNRAFDDVYLQEP